MSSLSTSTIVPKRRFRKIQTGSSAKSIFRFSLNPLLHRVSRIIGGLLVVGYLMGYQPTLAIPPIKQSVAEASSIQTQSITASSFSEAVNLPHPGYLTTKFSTWHPGVDIATGLGMPVRPILKGQVSEVVFSFWGLGNYVVVEHEQGIRSTYGHMGKVYTKKGEQVTGSSMIGEVGMSGWTSGPHTHLEVTKDGKNIDPQTLLPEIPKWEEYVKANAEVKPIGGIKN
jgi:murein DD-endopeptidase MepM/ murein hydrolase activator NlpD